MAHALSFPASARPLGLVERVKKIFADLRLYQTTVRELNALSDRELFDLGISRGSIHDIARQSVYA